MTSYSFGDLVLVPFPFLDLKTAKRRPALVLASFQPKTLPDFSIIAMVTSQLEGESLPGDYLLQKWESAGMLHPSKIRLAKLVSIENQLFLKKLGHLQSEDRKECARLLHQIFN